MSPMQLGALAVVAQVYAVHLRVYNEHPSGPVYYRTVYHAKDEVCTQQGVAPRGSWIRALGVAARGGFPDLSPCIARTV